MARGKQKSDGPTGAADQPTGERSRSGGHARARLWSHFWSRGRARLSGSTWLSGRTWRLAISATLVALLLRAALALTHAPALTTDNALLLIPLLAILFAAYRGGLVAGLLTTFLSTALLLLQAAPSPRAEYVAQLFAYVFMGCLFSAVCDRRGPAIARIEEERRRAEESAEAARAAEQRLQLLLDGITDYAIALLDPQGRVTSWNTGGERIQGWRAGEIVGQSFFDLYRAEDRAAALPEQLLGSALSAGRGEAQGWLLRRDGSAFRAHTVVAPVFDAAQRLRGFTLVTADVTERVRAEEERACAEEERGRLLALVQQADLWQRTFLREVLFNVTEGRLRLCEDRGELPPVREERGVVFPLRGAEALSAFRRRVKELATAEGFSRERCQDLVTGAAEMAMNAVAHGGGGEARLGTSLEGRVLQVWIEDQGGGMALGTLHRATLEKGYTTAGTMGYGWYLTLQTADRVWLLTGPCGTTVVLEMERERRPESVLLLAAAGGVGAQ
jgi:PAS domain S-box-containing protein